MIKDDRKKLKSLVRTMYDYQAMRITTANRLRIDAEECPIDESNMDDAIISDKDYEAVEYVRLTSQSVEKKLEKEIAKIVKKERLWTEFLEGVKGCGTLMSAAIMSEIDIHVATNRSKIYQFAGINSGMVKGKKIIKITSRTDMSKVIREYENRAGERCGIVEAEEMIRGDRKTKGYVAPFNGWLRTKLLGVLAGSFIKAGLRWVEIPEAEYVESAFTRAKAGKFEKCNVLSPYVEFYLQYKYRLSKSENKVMHMGELTEWRNVSPGHRENAARRYMIKMFLSDLYEKWRAIEGLEVRSSYQEDYLGHKHVG